MAHDLIQVQSRMAETVRWIQERAKELSPARFDKLSEEVAIRTAYALIDATPQGFSGALKAAWQVVRHAGGGWSVENPSPVMGYLERGTQAHGPTYAKTLFIPLSANAAMEGYQQGMVFGTDFVLAKRVRGIRAMKIAEKQAPITLEWLREAVDEAIEQSVRS